MKYVALCYNILTLCRTMKYVESIWTRENSVIIYSDVFNPIPNRVSEEYNVLCVSEIGLKESRGIKAIIKSCNWAEQLYNAVNSVIPTVDDFTIVVFRDNEVQEATVIERIKKRFGMRARIVLMEEGGGLYAVDRIKARFRLIKFFSYRVKNISVYPLKNRTQGMNDSLDEVICENVELFREKRSNIKISKMIEIFDDEFSEYLLSLFIPNRNKKKRIDYVFLTQPFSMFRDQYDELLSRHEDLLPKVFGILSKHGTTLIKPHPREDFDYSVYTNDKVLMIDNEEAMLPFECLMKEYGYPQLISMFSSVSISVKVRVPSIYLFRIFDIPGVEGIFTENFFEKNRIIVCDSLGDFEDHLQSP